MPSYLLVWRVWGEKSNIKSWNIIYENKKIKGFPEARINDEIIRISTFVGLHNDLKTLSKSLSGGMKRRLSVAMALIGDSKIIILDEPTSGLVCLELF